MEIFKYLPKERSYLEVYDIYNNVYHNPVVRSVAYATYHSHSAVEDALNHTFHSVLKNFDSEKGELENYIMVTVKTIDLNKCKDEYPSEKSIEIESNRQSFEKSKMSRVEFIRDVKSCRSELLKFIISNFTVLDKVFKGDIKGRVSTRDNEFMPFDKNILRKYDKAMVVGNTRELYLKYRDIIRKFIGLKGNVLIKDLEKFNSSVKFIGKIGTSFVVEKKIGSHKKYFYRLDLQLLMREMIEKFYSKSRANTGEYPSLDIEGNRFYKSINGNIYNDINELKKELELEIIYYICRETGLNILFYNKGFDVVFESSRERNVKVVLNAYNKKVKLDLVPTVVKEILID